MKELLTPRQVAKAIGASEASLKRWCDKGLVPAVRTAGGHRRLPLGGVLQFLRERGIALVEPEVLGLPTVTGKGEATIERARDPIEHALEIGDEEGLGRVLVDLYLGGHSVADIFDRAIAPAFRKVGERWQHGELEVFEERRGVEVCLRVLHRLRRLLRPIPADAPLALGGTLPGDPYAIPTTLVELSLRDAGWRAESYGVGLPASTFASAISRLRPRLFWLSVSAVTSPTELLESWNTVHSRASELGVPIVVGGQALTEDLRKDMQFTAHCDTMRHLVSFAKALEPRT